MSAHDQHVDSDPYDLEPLVAAGKVKVLRQSTLGTADTCLHRLTYDLDASIPYATGEARAVGTAYHRGLEVYYRNRSLGAAPDSVDFANILEQAQIAFKVESETPGFEWQEGEPAALTKIERMLRSYFDEHRYWPSDYEVLGVEHTFMHPFYDGWIVKGTVDLILRDPTGWVVIVDHKSAKRPWKKGKESHRSTNQPSWYAHFVRRIFDLDHAPAFVFDVMTYGGEFERRPAVVGPQHVTAVLAKAANLTALIDQGGPYPPNVSSFLCDARWCDHWQRCPWGEAFDSGVSAAPVEIMSSASTTQED